jgi:hypothetical protein
MELTLIENEGRTRIKVSRAKYPIYASIIDGYILLYGGRKERESSRYVYYIIDADVMARGLK